MNMTEEKIGFLKLQEYNYDMQQKANKMALKLENKIAKIRAMGYKVIVLGPKVKITIAK